MTPNASSEVFEKILRSAPWLHTTLLHHVAEMAEFDHSPLPPLYNDIGRYAKIRLLALTGRLEAGEIQISMQTFSIDDCPPYIALSYIWEPRHPLREISLNGRRVQIGTNLYDCLDIITKGIDVDAKSQPPSKKMVLRVGTSNVKHWSKTHLYEYMNNKSLWGFFWIDQLSVNQKDMAERSHQVKLMARVYSKAAFVLAWLGPAAGLNASSFRHSMLQTLPTPQQLAAGPYWSRPYKERQVKLAKEEEIPQQFVIAASPYWSRLWIVQEIILAKEILICTDVQNTLWNTNAEHSFRSLKLLQNSHMAIIMSERASWQSRQYRSSLDLLIELFSRQECADPRDTVFGLLSLVDSQDQGCQKITADYNKSSGQVYIDVLQAVQSSDRLRSRIPWDRFQVTLARGLRITRLSVPSFDRSMLAYSSDADGKGSEMEKGVSETQDQAKV
jgi:hypothetical protein